MCSTCGAASSVRRVIHYVSLSSSRLVSEFLLGGKTLKRRGGFGRLTSGVAGVGISGLLCRGNKEEERGRVCMERKKKEDKQKEIKKGSFKETLHRTSKNGQ